MTDSVDDKSKAASVERRSRRAPPPTAAAQVGSSKRSSRANVGTEGSHENERKQFAVPQRASAATISDPPVDAAKTTTEHEHANQEELKANNWVQADKIRDWRFNDRSAESLRDDPTWGPLTEEIRAEGIVVPILVRPLDKPEGGYTHEQVAGFRRLTAARTINPKMLVPVLEKKMDLDECVRKQATENKDRSNPSAWDRGLSFKAQWESKLWDTKKTIADLNKTRRESVSNHISLVENMPEDFKKGIRLRKLSFLACKALIDEVSRVPDNMRSEFIDRIIEVADDLDRKPEKAISVIGKAARKFESEQNVSEASKGPASAVYQSQKGKTMTMTRKHNRWDFTIHKDVFELVEANDLERLITDYLESKGLTLDKKEK